MYYFAIDIQCFILKILKISSHLTMIKTCSLLLQESHLVFYIAACSMNKSTYVLIHVLCDYLIPVPVNYSNLSGQSFCYCLKCISPRHNYLPQYTCISLRLSSLYNYHSFSSYCLLYCLQMIL